MLDKYACFVLGCLEKKKTRDVYNSKRLDSTRNIVKKEYIRNTAPVPLLELEKCFGKLKAKGY